MVRRGAVVAALVVLALLGVMPVGESTHETTGCARDLETITIGTDFVGIDLDVLEGVNHQDLPYPACSGGHFWIDHSSDPILTEQHCADKFLRVYAPAGALGPRFVINWVAGGGCA